MRPFIGRKQELQLLENAYTSKNAFVMVNGRRRVGKTALVRHFLKGKRALYFTAKEEVDVLSRRSFKIRVGTLLQAGFRDADRGNAQQQPLSQS